MSSSTLNLGSIPQTHQGNVNISPAALQAATIKHELHNLLLHIYGCIG